MLIKVLNAPENCCGLKEKTVLKIASDVGEKFNEIKWFTTRIPKAWCPFFCVDIIQSKVGDNFQLTSDWIKSSQNNVNKLKAITLLGSLTFVVISFMLCKK